MLFTGLCLHTPEGKPGSVVTPSQSSVLVATWHCCKPAKHKSGAHSGLLALAWLVGISPTHLGVSVYTGAKTEACPVPAQHIHPYLLRPGRLPAAGPFLRQRSKDRTCGWCWALCLPPPHL